MKPANTSEYFKLLSPDFPDWLHDYLDAEELQAQKHISITCGTIYSDLFHTNVFYSSLDHSIGVALIVWHFTHDQKQTLAGLFHDISTPAFKHCVDFLNGDHEKQESTEDLTTDFIQKSATIPRLLQRDHIEVAEIDNYHLYPIADNDTPQLSADRLEYSLSNSLFTHQLLTLDEIAEIYHDIKITKNESGQPELGFQTQSLAEKFVQVTSLLSIAYRDDKTRFSMQFIADILKALNNDGKITIADLYRLKESDIITIIENSPYQNAFNAWRQAKKVHISPEKPQNPYSVHLKSKIRYIDPLCRDKRLSKISPAAHAAIAKNLSYNMDNYVFLDFNLKDSASTNHASQKYHVIDLFSGVGGLSFGFAQLKDFDIVAANEILPDIAKTYKLNHPNAEVLNCDICDLTTETLEAATKNQKIDLIVGGPPCQSYSTLGKRQMDQRANLFTEYKRILEILKPQAFIFENVSGLLSMQGGKLFPKIRAEFESIGYHLKYQLLNAAEYGVPQERKRVILVGFKGKNTFEYPKPTHGPGLKPFVTLEEAIGDLPAIKSGETNNHYAKAPDNEFLNFVRKNNTTVLTEHSAPKNNPELIKIMEALGDGQDKNDLPANLRPKSGYGNTYAKLWWKKPSTTITRNFSCPSSSRCIHPRDSRALSIREGARLQSFPDDYKFCGSKTNIKLGIGNAVPCLLSVALAKQMLKALKKSKNKKS